MSVIGAATTAAALGAFAKAGLQNKNNNSIGSYLASAAKNISNTYADAINAQIASANAANSASAAAQRQQALYNSELQQAQINAQNEMIKQQQSYNMQSARESNALTEKLFNQQMTYNTKEAETQRNWQEYMAGTAYQRTVADMKSAGINPILAAQNGATAFGSGAAASTTNPALAQASANSGSAAGASVGNYTGQMYHVSDQMAILGSVIGGLADFLNSSETVSAADNSVVGKVMGVVKEGTQGLVDELKYDWNATKQNWGLSKETSGGGGHGF